MWKYQKNFNDVQVTVFKEIAELENKISGFDQSKSEETSEHTNKESDTQMFESRVDFTICLTKHIT